MDPNPNSGADDYCICTAVQLLAGSQKYGASNTEIETWCGRAVVIDKKVRAPTLDPKWQDVYLRHALFFQPRFFLATLPTSHAGQLTLYQETSNLRS